VQFWRSGPSVGWRFFILDRNGIIHHISLSNSAIWRAFCQRAVQPTSDPEAAFASASLGPFRSMNISRRSDVGCFSKKSVGMWGTHLVPFYLSGRFSYSRETHRAPAEARPRGHRLATLVAVAATGATRTNLARPTGGRLRARPASVAARPCLLHNPKNARPSRRLGLGCAPAGHDVSSCQPLGPAPLGACLRLSKHTLIRDIRRGLVKSTRYGKRVLIPKVELFRLAAEGVQPEAKPERGTAPALEER